MIAEVEPFHAITISRLAHQLEGKGHSIIHMRFGQPSTGAPARAIETAHHILDTEPMGYESKNVSRHPIPADSIALGDARAIALPDRWRRYRDLSVGG